MPPERKSSARIQSMLDELAKGRNPADVYDENEARKQKGRESAERGHQAEVDVRNLIKSRPYVMDARVSSGSESRDRKRQDVVAYLDENEFVKYFAKSIYIPNSLVYVQVKAGQEGIFKYKAWAYKNHGISAEYFPDWLRNNQQILLHTAQSDKRILERFDEQLVAINSFWLEKKNR